MPWAHLVPPSSIPFAQGRREVGTPGCVAGLRAIGYSLATGNDLFYARSTALAGLVPWDSSGEGWRVFEPATLPINHDFLPWLGGCTVDIPSRHRPWNLDARDGRDGR